MSPQEPSLNALKEAIEGQWCTQMYHMESSVTNGDRDYYKGAVDALEEAMVEFDQNWVATLRRVRATQR